MAAVLITLENTPIVRIPLINNTANTAMATTMAAIIFTMKLFFLSAGRGSSGS